MYPLDLSPIEEKSIHEVKCLEVFWASNPNPTQSNLLSFGGRSNKWTSSVREFLRWIERDVETVSTQVLPSTNPNITTLLEQFVCGANSSQNQKRVNLISCPYPWLFIVGTYWVLVSTISIFQMHLNTKLLIWPNGCNHRHEMDEMALDCEVYNCWSHDSSWDEKWYPNDVMTSNTSLYRYNCEHTVFIHQKQDHTKGEKDKAERNKMALCEVVNHICGDKAHSSNPSLR